MGLKKNDGLWVILDWRVRMVGLSEIIYWRG